jgi:hypothetical protein
MLCVGSNYGRRCMVTWPDHPGSPTQDRQAQRARAARCAVNNTAPGRQPAATVPSRRSSDWRPGPERLACILTAPPGAYSSSPAASVHPSVRPREPASPAQPPAQGDGGLQHAPALRESTMALTESVGAQTGAPDRLARIVDNPSTYPASPRPPGLPRLPRHCT